MLPFEFTIDGPPISQQTRHAERRHAWRSAVRTADSKLWPKQISPITEQLKFTVTYYHDGVMVRYEPAVT